MIYTGATSSGFLYNLSDLYVNKKSEFKRELKLWIKILFNQKLSKKYKLLKNF